MKRSPKRPCILQLVFVKMVLRTYTIAPTESAYIWNELLVDVKERGVEEVLLFISDGLKGIVTAIEQVYPKAKYQSCCVHVARNIAHKVRVSDRASICDDFKASISSRRRAVWESCSRDFL